jgi:predicted nucleotidyltransferase component of viral defense system
VSPKTPKNTAASVRVRLLAIAKERKVEFTHVLQQYVNERILYRLSKTRYADDFVLKGGTLFGLLIGQPYRPTKDLDFLGAGDNEPGTLSSTFLAVLAVEEDDGIVFHMESLEAGKIKQEEQYEGVRISCTAAIEQASIPVQIDIGFGDAIISRKKVELQTLLNVPRPELFVYPLESVVSEKFEALVKLGLTNSRMKDFYDIYTLASAMDFEGATLCEAIRQTFLRRQTPIPAEAPLALTKSFFKDKDKVAQWKAFTKKAKLLGDVDLQEVCTQIHQFIMPVSVKAATTANLEGTWSSRTGWILKN